MVGVRACWPQAAGLVPVVEPEILIDGDHDIVRFREVTERVVSETVAQLWRQVSAHTHEAGA